MCFPPKINESWSYCVRASDASLHTWWKWPELPKLPRLNSAGDWCTFPSPSKRPEATKDKINLVVLWFIDSNKDVIKWMEIHIWCHALPGLQWQCWKPVIFQGPGSRLGRAQILFTFCTQWKKAPKPLSCALLTAAQMQPNPLLLSQNKSGRQEWHTVMFNKVCGTSRLFWGSDEEPGMTRQTGETWDHGVERKSSRQVRMYKEQEERLSSWIHHIVSLSRLHPLLPCCSLMLLLFPRPLLCALPVLSACTFTWQPHDTERCERDGGKCLVSVHHFILLLGISVFLSASRCISVFLSHASLAAVQVISTWAMRCVLWSVQRAPASMYKQPFPCLEALSATGLPQDVCQPWHRHTHTHAHSFSVENPGHSLIHCLFHVKTILVMNICCRTWILRICSVLCVVLAAPCKPKRVD